MSQTITRGPRIAICGAGISGLTLAGILARRLNGAGKIEVFERATADRDQGYGLDLDEHGQEALARAGVYDRFWEIARPRSDAGMAFFQAQAHGPDAIPFFHMYQPRWMQKMLRGNGMAARPECNREKLRDLLLDALSEHANVGVHFETATGDIREVAAADGGQSTAELFDRDGKCLGEFDLVTDAMGLHSTLRQHAVHDALGKHYEGNVMFHGSITDPDATFSPELLARFAPFGTSGVMCKGGHFFMQRYGAGADDHRTSLFYVVPRADGEAAIFDELGIERPSSREGGIMRDAERLGKVKAWIKDDMGDAFCPIWKEAIDQLERVTVRGSVTHGVTSLKKDITLPLICVGDSLRNCGLGGGGMLAMQDAVELAKVLLPDDETGSQATPFFEPATGRVSDLAPLRLLAEVMLTRKNEHNEQKERRNVLVERRAEGDARGVDLTWDDVRDTYELGTVKFWAMRLLLPRLQALVRRWYVADLSCGLAGSTPENAIVYKNVTDYLLKEKEKEKALKATAAAA